MRKTALLLLLLPFCGNLLHAQDYQLNLKAQVIKGFSGLKKGDNVILKEMHHDIDKLPDGSLQDVFYVIDANEKKINVSGRMDDSFEFSYGSVDDFWDAQIMTKVLSELKKRGMQYSLRRDLEGETLDFIQAIQQNDLVLNDPYLETYLYGILNKLAPNRLVDGRPCSPNLIILKSPVINASTYPNGTIVIHTGLLAALHSEDELAAILGHELAHFVLNHTIENINKAKDRAKRAEFWSSLATGLAAMGEVALSASNRYYQPGGLTYSVAALSAGISAQINAHMGMQYNHDQEHEADAISKQLLQVAGYNPDAMANALSRLADQYVLERNNALWLDSYTHPALMERLKANGVANNRRDVAFEKAISFAVSNVAAMKFHDRRFRQCLPLVNQNIENGVATADDYLMRTFCTIATTDGKQANQEIMGYLDKAKQLDPDNPFILQGYTIAKIHAGQIAEAKTLLAEYETTIKELSQGNGYFREEYDWAKRMKAKLNNM